MRFQTAVDLHALFGIGLKSSEPCGKSRHNRDFNMPRAAMARTWPAPVHDTLETRLSSLVHTLTDLLSPAWQSIEWTVTVSGACPPELVETVMRVSREALVNAIRHGLRGRTQGCIEVMVSAWPSAGELHVSIIDDGCGPPAGYLGGCGEGLALMRGLAQDSGGDMILLRDANATTAFLLLPVGA